MIIGVLQPGYLPWLGFFEQMHKCDVFVIYDDVQYDKNGWRNRNRIKSPQGPKWLTVPVSVRNFPLIKDVQISNETNWRKKHILTIRQSYSSAPFFRHYFKDLEDILNRNWTSLLELDMIVIRYLADILGINTQIELSSGLNITAKDRIDKLISICTHLNGDTFYEGLSGKGYIRENELKRFKEAGIEVVFQSYNHPVYNQLFGDFTPYLSVIDLIFNEGPESLKILTHQD